MQPLYGPALERPLDHLAAQRPWKKAASDRISKQKAPLYAGLWLLFL